MNSSFSALKEFSPLLKLLSLLILSLIGLIVFMVLGVIVVLPFYGSEIFDFVMGSGDTTSPIHINIMKYLQILSHFGFFIMPAIFFAHIFESGFKSFFFFIRTVRWNLIFLGALLLLFQLPVVNYLAYINSLIVFPESMKAVEEWMRITENEAEKIILLFLDNPSVLSLIVNLFMIAIIPAIGEELIFRGILLRLLKRWWGNIHLAVLMSAIIFSIIHFQFYGFLPRVFLGIILGYLFVWTGSLWVPIVAHFVNNASAVLVGHFYFKGDFPVKIDEFGNFNNEPVLLVFLTFIAALSIVGFWFANKKTSQFYNNIGK